MKPVRTGIVGLGGMGKVHVSDCQTSEAVELCAVCDVDPARVQQVTDTGTGVKGFTDPVKMLDAADLEAVIIASPHYSHAPTAIAAFDRQVSVLCEKPVGVHVADVRMIIDAYEAARAENPELVFGAVFQQRTLGYWKKIKEFLDSGVLGRLVRTTWIVTDWFRSQSYFDSSTWRATWKGEGGGVLLNQCPHNLDLYQWFFGMPHRVFGIASIAKYHDIETEDEVTAVFDHDNGMIGHFITSTAESPGTNRLEIVGENGILVYEKGTVTLDRNETSMLEFIRESQENFARVPHATEPVEIETSGGGHREVTDRFAGVIRGEGELVADGREGMHSVMLANAALLSHFTGGAVALPLDAGEYVALLERLIDEAGRTREKRHAP